MLTAAERQQIDRDRSRGWWDQRRALGICAACRRPIPDDKKFPLHTACGHEGAGVKPSPASRVLQGSTSGYLSEAAFTNLIRPATLPSAVDETGASWWTQHADPALPRERFTFAAQQRDAEMRATSSAWRSPKPVNTVSLT